MTRVTNSELKAAFEEHKDAVYRFAWRMTGSPAVAEDIAQEVFLSLVRQPQRFDPVRGTMRSFLLAIARNLSLKRWRDEHPWEELGEEDYSCDPIDPVRIELGEVVGKAVQSLPPLQREVLILYEYEEFTLDQIARLVAAEIGTVKSRLHRARENLKRALAHLGNRETVNKSRSTNHGTIK